MDLRKVKKLIELLEESNLSELEIREGEETVRLSRFPTAGAIAQQMIAAPAPAMAASGPAPVAAPEAAATPATAEPGLPPGTDLTRYDTVVIWCETFSQFITAARYR